MSDTSRMVDGKLVTSPVSSSLNLDNSGRSGVPLQCPECGKDFLYVSDAALSCSICQRKWLVDDGVALLCREQYDTYIADELTFDEAAYLLSQADLLGVRRAFTQTLRCLPQGTADYLERYVFSESRGLLIDLLDVAESHLVLDHGCGWGNLTCSLARTVRSVVAMDLVSQRAKFTGIRARQEGLNNVVPLVSGDYERLPFPAESFDVVVVNGVLEWVPSVFSGNPKRIQEKRLREVSRILKPGGQLLLTIENRYWWKYFFGKPEAHTGIPWAALVPRWITNLLARRKGKSSFRAYTHSLIGYHRLLSRNGFERIAPYVTIPEYNFPEAIVPALNRPVRYYTYKDSIKQGRLKLLKRIAYDLGILPHLAYCYAFVCYRRNSS